MSGEVAGKHRAAASFALPAGTTNVSVPLPALAVRRQTEVLFEGDRRFPSLSPSSLLGEQHCSVSGRGGQFVTPDCGCDPSPAKKRQARLSQEEGALPQPGAGGELQLLRSRSHAAGAGLGRCDWPRCPESCASTPWCMCCLAPSWGQWGGPQLLQVRIQTQKGRTGLLSCSCEY